jgi:hypothetical protein
MKHYATPNNAAYHSGQQSSQAEVLQEAHRL